MNPVSSCADCQKSEGDRYTTDRFHLWRGHGGFVREHLLQTWFLLMNGVFFFIMQELVLGSLNGLLGCAVAFEVVHFDFGFSAEEVVYLFVCCLTDGSLASYKVKR